MRDAIEQTRRDVEPAGAGVREREPQRNGGIVGHRSVEPEVRRQCVLVEALGAQAVADVRQGPRIARRAFDELSERAAPLLVHAEPSQGGRTLRKEPSIGEDVVADLIPYAIAVDDKDVYYTTAPDIDEQSSEKPCTNTFGTVRRVSKTGNLQVSTVVASGQACPIGLALGEDAVYWANLGAGQALSGSVWRKPKVADAGTELRLANNVGRPTSLVFQAGRLAWNVPASQRVESCTAPTCSDLKTLANEQLNPSGLSADDSGIYWVVLGTPAQNFTDGALRRASLPK